MASSNITPKEKAVARLTLVCLIQALEGMTTTVELRNESTVTGYIEVVDAYMGVTMRDVKLTTMFGKVIRLSHFFVLGKNIRYVQIPDEVDIRKAISSQTVSRSKVLKAEQENRRQIVKAKMERKMKERLKDEQKEQRKHQESRSDKR